MSSIFKELIKRSKRISKDDFATDFGNITEDVIDMLNGTKAQKVVREAREEMESSQALPNGSARLRTVEFGLFSTAPELENGIVAAIDGTPVLPTQLYSSGQALCVGVGSISHRRGLLDSLHYWSSKSFLEDAKDTNDFINRQEQGLFGISQTAFLRYWEVSHANELEENHIFFDGTLVYEWLVATTEGVNLYDQLFKSGKKCMGIMKNLKSNAVFANYARAIKTGEIYVIETLADHLDNSNVSNRNRGESESKRYTLPEFKNNLAPKILRGLFKPRKKAFGFEVHIDHLEDMLRIMSADVQLNNPGHEIPYLLNRVDEEIRKTLNSKILKDRISYTLATSSEELFFEETNEREFRN
jgi:hypothetical protein